MCWTNWNGVDISLFFQVNKITVLFKITGILDTSNRVICFWFLFAKYLYLVSVFFVCAKVLNWLSGKSYTFIWVVTFSGHLLEFFSKLPYTHNTVVWHYSWGDMNKCLLTSVREPMISFIGVTYQEHGWGAIYTSRNYSDICIIKVHPIMGDKPQKQETWSSLFNL